MSRDLSIPALAATAVPEFSDAATCKTWLDNLPLTDVATAQQLLIAELQEFNRLPTRAANRLAVLETLRETVAFVQIEQAKRFTNRALPMVDDDAAVFERTIQLWEQMRLGYLRCLDAAAAGDVNTRPRIGLICQRALAYVGLKMFHHHRAYREVPARDWRSLHAIYANAEKLGVAEEPVKDYLNRDVSDTSARVAYVRALLMASAGPHELTQRQLTFVAFLLERWATKAAIVARAPQGDSAPALRVDLAGDGPPQRVARATGEPSAAGVRHLDLRAIAKSLRGRIALLRKGESPAKLGLGEDCVQPTCEQLLVVLYRQWCSDKPQRPAERRRASDAIQACIEMAAIRYYIAGRVFRQPGEQTELTHKQRDEIATFGRVSTRDEDDYSVAQGFILEHWQLVDQDAQGLRMVRKSGYPGKRYAHGQLVAVRPADTKNFMLGQVKWMACSAGGDLSAGIRLLPGLPAPTAIRPAGLNSPSDKYVEALSLTAAPSLNAPPALVLPLGWYKPERVVEVYVDSPVQVHMTSLLERGSDFERVAYEVVSGA